MDDVVAQATSGAIGGAIGRATAYPLDSLKIRVACSSTERTVTDIIKEDGVLSLYRGVHLSVLEASWSKAITFYAYSSLKKRYVSLRGQEPGFFSGVFLAYVADLLTVPACAPIEVVVSNLQFGNTKILRNLSVPFFMRAIRRAFDASIFLSLKPALELAFFEALKKRVLKLVPSISPLIAFFLGALARFGATMIVYPILRVKLMAQLKTKSDKGKGDEEDEDKGILATCANIAKNDGIATLYRGISVELARGISQSSVMFMVMEKVNKMITESLGKV